MHNIWTPGEIQCHFFIRFEYTFLERITEAHTTNIYPCATLLFVGPKKYYEDNCTRYSLFEQVWFINSINRTFSNELFSHGRNAVWNDKHWIRLTYKLLGHNWASNQIFDKWFRSKCRTVEFFSHHHRSNCCELYIVYGTLDQLWSAQMDEAIISGFSCFISSYFDIGLMWAIIKVVWIVRGNIPLCSSISLLFPSKFF